MSYRNQRSVPVSSPSPSYFSTLQSGSYLTPNITNAGQTSIYALAGAGSGNDAYYNNVYASTIIANSTITERLFATTGLFSTMTSTEGIFNTITATNGVFNTITSLSSITVDATDGNLKVLGGIDLDGNILTTDSGAGGELLLNGIPIATTASLSSINTWANFPAISSINVDGNNILNANSIIAEDGNDLAIRASVGNSLILQGEITFDKLGGLLPAEIKLVPDGTVSFGTLFTGQLTNISTINGLPYVPGGGSIGVATINGLDGAVTLAQGTGITLNTNGGTKTVTINANAPGVSDTISGVNTFMTATGSLVQTANSIITAGGGLGGNIQLTASAGNLGVSGGNISLVSNGGTGLGGLYGIINLTANAGTDLITDIATGGSINITANSPVVGLTSKVAITGGGVNIYSGIFSPIASEFGYTFLNASLGISLVAGSFTSAFQSPGTVYLYGAQGTVIDNGLFITDIQPLWNGNPFNPPANLTIHGRTTGAGNASVVLNNVASMSMEGSGAITGVNTINGSPYVPGGGGGSYPPDITVSTITFNPLNGNISSLNAINNGILFTDTGNKISFLPNLLSEYIGEFDGLKAINTNLGIGSFGESITFAPDVNLSTVGAINGLSTINGQAWVNGGGGGSYPAVASFSTITMNNVNGIINAFAIINPDTNGNDFNLSQENATGGIYMNVRPSAGAVVVGEVRINGAGNIGFNNLAAGDGIQINPEGDTLTFLTAGVDKGQIVGLSTINGVAYLPTSSSPTVYQATYYKSANQILNGPNAPGNTDITFDLTGSWNNTGGYITHTNGTTDFTVVQTGLYFLEFNANIQGAGVAWTGSKQVNIDITRSPIAEQAVIQQSATQNSGTDYGQCVSATYYLVAGDVINLRVFNIYTSLTQPLARGVANTFDLNTFFTWRFVELGGATAYQNPPPVIQSATTTALIPSSANTTYILTGGTIQNFTTAGLGAGNAGAVWYVKNSSNGDKTIRHNGTNITGDTSTVHQGSGSTNSSSQILYWNGTDLIMY